jgi:Ca2+/H+ antiporter
MCALVLPAAFQFSLSSLSTTVATRPIEEITDLDSSQRATLLSISRGVSFMLLSTYAVYLVFQLYSELALQRGQLVIKRRLADVFARCLG